MAWKPLPDLSPKETAPFRNARKARFFVDESLGQGTTATLRAHAMNVKDVWEVGLLGRPDKDVFAFCRENNRILLSHDPDFLDDRAFPLKGCPGVIILPGASGDEEALLVSLGALLRYVWPFGQSFKETKTVIGADRVWTAKLLDRKTGKIHRNRYQFRKNLELELELTRFRGHFILCKEGDHDAQIKTAVSGRISPADRRAVARRQIEQGALA